MSIETNLQQAAETPVIEPIEATDDGRRHLARKYLAVGLAGIALGGGFAGWSKFRAYAAESCEQTFNLPMDGSVEPVLRAPDGTHFKLRVSQAYDDKAVELGFLAYGRHEKPSMFDMFSGEARLTRILPADFGTGPEATFAVDDQVKLLVDVTADSVKTRCISAETAVHITTR